MASRESQIARQLSGLPFVKSPEIREEIRQSIIDYFVNRDDEEFEDSSDEQSSDTETGAETVQPVGVESTTDMVTSLPQPSSASPGEQVERDLLEIGLHNLWIEGDEGMRPLNYLELDSCPFCQQTILNNLTEMLKCFYAI